MTFELAWKTLRDYLTLQAVPVKYPREVLKQAFHYELISDGECWLEMLERNIMAHVYDEQECDLALDWIRKSYSAQLESLLQTLTKLRKSNHE